MRLRQRARAAGHEVLDHVVEHDRKAEAADDESALARVRDVEVQRQLAAGVDAPTRASIVSGDSPIVSIRSAAASTCDPAPAIVRERRPGLRA